MQNRICRCFLFGVAIMLISCSGGKAPPVIDDHTGYGHGGGPPEVRGYGDIENRILALSGNLFNVEVLQTVDCGQDTCDIYRITFNENHPKTKKILLIGAVHGDEPAGAEALMRLLEIINTRSGNFNAFTITIIPVLNPWGWVHDRRNNARNIDLNNDFSLFQAPEVRALAHHPVDRKYDLVLDLHEAGQTDHFICCYGDGTRDICESFSRNFKQKGYVLDDTYQDILSQTRDGVMSIPLWMVSLSGLSDSVALPHWFYLKGNTAVMTLVSSKTSDLESRVNFHLDTIRFFLGKLGQELIFTEK